MAVSPNYLGISEAPSGQFKLATKADANLADGTCRALLVGTAGTANLMDAAGNTLTDVPLQQGYNPLAVKQVRTGGPPTTSGFSTDARVGDRSFSAAP